ncbi:ADP-ribosylation_factor 1 [Hexamita inflata]|uniref:ADP-ribosylation factor 1 n=1 Tax=Hexamita inflata TaxID=28002 RepID=A0AA86Q6W9_9EUKA|nr:ADP-ribosylation factor 1 [Hexamita inflata]
MNLCCRCQENSQINVSMFGLENAGKTQLLYQWCVHEFVETTPTIAFNRVETIQRDEVSVAIWDIGGQPKSRQFWRYYLQSASVIQQRNQQINQIFDKQIY